MSKKGPSQAKILLSQAKSYENLSWLGILFLPLVYIFGTMARNKVTEAAEYGFTKEEEKTAKAIRDSSRNIMVVMSVVYLMLTIGFTILAVNTHNANSRNIRKIQDQIQNQYRYYK